MQKRLLLVLLIILALLGLFAVYWFVLKPVLPGAAPAQPPALQPEVPFNPQQAAVPQQPQAPAQAPSATDPAEQERQAQDALKRASLDIAARVGSYSNADNFDALRVMEANVGTEYAAKLETLRQQLVKAHPVYGPAWGQTLRTLSATIDQSSIPVLNRGQVVTTVQGQLTVMNDGKSTTSYVSVTLTLKPITNGWMATDATFTSLAR